MRTGYAVAVMPFPDGAAGLEEVDDDGVAVGAVALFLVECVLSFRVAATRYEAKAIRL